MRRKTIVVKVGNGVISSEEPIMIQSMLNTPTMDTEACVSQAARIIDAGGQLVRITAQGVKEAENLKNIRELLYRKGYHAPISADIHFHPEAALTAAHHIEKVRINPGNFADKRAVFRTITYTDGEYSKELRDLKETLTSFLDVCRENGTAVRIGTNHGSLSDRIMSRYGNTPAGMVEATMEYLRVCKENGFEDVVVSLKSSDCGTMIDAVRLLVEMMDREEMAYPLHLGVTEAGEGEDGRIRSAIGIGTLLNEGVGDTIRVSLTEPPENEIPVAKHIIHLSEPQYDKQRKHTKGDFGKPVIVADISQATALNESVSELIGFSSMGVDIVHGEQLSGGAEAPEMIYTESLGPELTKLPPDVTIIVPYANIEIAHVYNRNTVPLFTAEQFLNSDKDWPGSFVLIHRATEIDNRLAERLKKWASVVPVLAPDVANYHVFHDMLRRLRTAGVVNKPIIKTHFNESPDNTAHLQLAVHTGGLFIDRLAYGLWIAPANAESMAKALELSRNILQSAGLRRYKTAFISCPGCGRTLFDLQGTVAKVKAAFSDKIRLKIAVMGCVVNGPGEMGDADFGYVGAGNGKVNLYKGKELMKVGIKEEYAIEELQKLIGNAS